MQVPQKRQLISLLHLRWNPHGMLRHDGTGLVGQYSTLCTEISDEMLVVLHLPRQTYASANNWQVSCGDAREGILFYDSNNYS